MRFFQECGRCEGVQGVFTLVFGEVAQAFHDDRIVELSGQLEEEEQKGIRTGDNHKHKDDHGMWMGRKTQDLRHMYMDGIKMTI